MVIRPNAPLRLLLPILLAIVTLVAGVTILLIELYLIPGRVAADVIQEARQDGTPLQGNINRFYRLGDETGVEVNLAWTSTHELAAGAAVIDDRGKVIEATRIEWKGRPASEVLPRPLLDPGPPERGSGGAIFVSETDPKLVIVRYPVRLPSERPATMREGTLIMALDMTPQLEEARRTAWGRFRWSILALLAIAGVFGLLLNALVSHRAQSLVTQAKAIAAGNLAARTELRGHDELAGVGHTLDEMADQIRRSAALLNGIVNGTADAVFAKDLEGKYLLINPAAANFIDKTAPEIIGQDDFALFPPEDATTIMTNDRSVMQSGCATVTEERIRGAGMTRTYLSHKFPLVDGQDRVVGMIGIARDITDRVESEKRYRALSEMSPVGLFRSDATGYCRYVNPRWSEITRMPAEQALGQGWRSTIHPDDSVAMSVAQDWYAALPLGQAEGDRPKIYRVEYRVLRPDGSVVWTLGQVAPEIDPDGKITGWVGTLTDITDRKQAEAEQKKAEAQIQALNADLERRVHERTEELGRTLGAFRAQSEELARANTELARAARLKDNFLASMSHELRTPLHGVLSLSQLLQDGVYGEISPEQASALQDIEQSGSHLLALINDILDLSKAEAGQIQLQTSPMMVSTLCASSLRIVREMAQKNRLRLTTSIDEPISMIDADERCLKQILVNLLSNAVKFTPEGGAVGLHVTADPGRGVIAFTVRDTGIGIRREDMDMLFQPFQQIDSRLSREYAGTGLGLALVARLAKLHGGSVSLESEPGAGSAFTIQIPWRPVDADEAEDPKRYLTTSVRSPRGASAAAADSSGVRVLLADDNDVSARVIGDCLGAVGYTVIRAVNGAQAVEKARELYPALILMDIQMPGMDGLEATREIRQIPAICRIPIVAVTALAMPGDRERCLSAGVDEYLTKPLDLAALRGMVERLTGGAILAVDGKGRRGSPAPQATLD